MKRTILIILAVLAVLYACPQIQPEPEPTKTPIPQETPEPITPEETAGPVLFAVYDGNNLRFWDGENLTNGYTGDIKVAGNRKLSIGDVLIRTS